MNTCEIHQLI